MRCFEEWRNLRGTSGKGLKTQTVMAHPYQVTLTAISTFKEPLVPLEPLEPLEPLT